MTLQGWRLPYAFDPLIGEAKRRARLRRFLTISALLVIVAIGLWFALRPSGGGPTGGFALNSPSTRVGALAVPIPSDFHRYVFRVGDHRTGIQPRVVGVLTTDYRLSHSPSDVLTRWASLSSGGPPAKRVALEVGLDDRLGMISKPRLHLPLSLHQPWFHEHFSHGVVAGYRYGDLSFHGQLYDILFWSGRAAPPPDRAAVRDMLASIRPAP